MMLVKSMHQIARIEFRNSKFPYARGLCPLATPARGLCPLDTRQGASPLEPPSLVNNLGPPPLSSGWIRPCQESHDEIHRYRINRKARNVDQHLWGICMLRYCPFIHFFLFIHSLSSPICQSRNFAQQNDSCSFFENMCIR